MTGIRFYSKNFSFRYSSAPNHRVPKEQPLSVHDVFELIFIRKGKGVYMVEGKQYPLQRNSLIVTHPGKLHRVHIESDETRYERYIIMYDPKCLLPELQKEIPEDLDMLYLGNNHCIIDAFERMEACWQQFEGVERERLLNILCEEIFFYIRLYAGQAAKYRAVAGNPLIPKAIAYIEENITTLSGVGEICDALFITKAHLHHLFIDHLRTTPNNYIIAKRLTLAQQAIRAGEKPTKVYLECGFRNYATFYRDYKLFYGHSPSEEGSLPSIPE